MTGLSVIASSRLELPAQNQPLDLNTRLKDETGRAGPRRVNRFVRLALLGARRCVGTATLPANTSIYLTSQTGPVADTADLLAHAAQRLPLPPVRFVNVSSNMVSYYLAAEFGLHGSNQVVMARDLALYSLLETAYFNLRPGATALIGAVEECVWPLEAHRQRLGLPTSATLADSTHWLLVQRRRGNTDGVIPVCRLRDDSAARHWLATQPAERGAVNLSAAAAAALGADLPANTSITAVPCAANGLTDAATTLHWLTTLDTRSTLLDRSNSGRWSVLSASPTTESAAPPRA